MPENNQASGKTKPEATGSSSTQPGSQAIDMNHTNAIVPHQISNHDKLVQTMVMVDGEWINVNDTNDQKNVQEDMRKVNRVVTEAQKDIINAQNAADSAVKSADSAISASKVNSDAIAAQEEAISEAKNALDSVATEIQLTASNAASDAASIRADVAKIESEVASAKSASQNSVNALQSDVDAAKKDLADAHSGLLNAQAAIDQNKKLINDSVAKINNDIAQNRKDLAAAQQANADTAKKLDSYTKQAIEQGKTIEKLQTDDNSTKLTIADIKGNVSQVQGSVTGLAANLKDANDNLATVKALADSLSSTLTDHGKNIASLQATAKELSSTLGDADGRLSKVEQTAKEHSTTISNLRSEVEWKQVSNSALDTMKSAGHFWGTGKDLTGKPGNIKDTDQVRVVVDVPSDDSISQILYANNIVWQRSFNGNAWSEWVRSANQGDVDTLQGNITQVKQTADGLTDTLKDAQGNIDKVRATAKGLSEQITNAQGAITNLQTDVTGIKATIADHDKNIHTLQADAKSLTDDMTDAQGNISKLQKASTDLTSEMQDHDGRLSKVEQTAGTLTNEFADQQGSLNRVEQTAQGTQQTVANQQGQINTIKTDAAGIHQALTGQGNQIANINVTLSGLNTKYEGVSGDLNNLKSQAQWATVTSAVDLNNVKTPCHKFLKGTVTNAPNEVAWWYLTVEGSEGNRVTQTVIAGQSNNRYTRRFADSWSAWVRDATQTDVTALSNRITTNSTQITQNKQAIALKADQSSVNNLSGEVSQNKAQLKVQAGQISSKVSSEDFSALNDRAMQNRGTVSAPDFNSLIQAGYYTVTMPYNGKNYPTVNWGTLEVSGQASDANGRLNQKYVSDNNVETYVRQYNANTKSWTAWIKTANQNDINTLDGKISKNSTAIDQTNKQVSLKADQTEVNNAKEIASQNSSRLDVMADEIKQKVDGTAVNSILDSKGYATMSYTQTLVNQTKSQWDVTATNLTDRFNTLQVSIDGLQSTVRDKADQSQLTQLSNLVQSKVSTSDFTSKVSQLSNDINARVTKDGLLSQINLQAGSTLIQSGKIYLDAKSVVFGQDSQAFIPAALITNLTADQITTGTLKSIQIDNGDGKFTVNSSGDVVANRIKIREGNIYQGDIIGANFYAITNTENKRLTQPINSLDNVDDANNNWFKINGNILEWHHVPDEYASIGPGLAYMKYGFNQPPDSNNQTQGLTITDTKCVTLSTGHQAHYQDDPKDHIYTKPIKNNWNMGWADETRLEVQSDKVQVTLSNDGGPVPGAQFSIQKDDRIGAYFGRGDHGNVIQLVAVGDGGNVDVNSSLTVHGAKNAVVPTSQGTVAINAYETAEYYFGDIGEDQTNGDGKVWVSIDYLFGQTVNTSVPYQVFVTPYSSAHVWVSKRLKNRFLVESDKPSASFAWEIKAKRKGYEHTRLKNVDNMMEKPAGVK